MGTVTDGAHGALVLWSQPELGLARLRMRHVLGGGVLDPAWPAEGLALGVGSAAASDAVLVSDEAGGAVAVWTDSRTGTAKTYAQRVRSNGSVDPAWPAGGVPISSASGTQRRPAVAGDGAGGVFVTWEDTRTGGNARSDLYAQHVRADGSLDPAWPALGAAVCTAIYEQFDPAIVADGMGGGAQVAWFDRRQTTAYEEVWTQRLDSTGALASGWPVNGITLASGDGIWRSELKLASDHANGFFALWNESPAFDNHEVRLIRVGVNGAPVAGWPAGGLELSEPFTASLNGRMVVDDSGPGAPAVLATWAEYFDFGIHARRVLGDGTFDPAWPASPANLLPLPMTSPKLTGAVSDDTGGLILLWSAAPSSSGSDDNIFASHVLATGTPDPAWPVGGALVCGASGMQGPPAAISDGTGGALAVWAGDGIGTTANVNAQRVDRGGIVGPLAAGVGRDAAVAQHAFALPSPQPAHGASRLSFTLGQPGRVRLSVFDTNGRRVRALWDGALPAGAHSMSWDLRDEQGGHVAPGLYFAKLSASGRELTQRIVVLD
ncbi:MAG: hypothetical protein IT348_15805 [Candidatus Eisenbacteria bacterium]|nr:hypothetical protein [Candidatus Eisenbacteria bacterium]